MYKLTKEEYKQRLIEIQQSGLVPFSLLRCRKIGSDKDIFAKVPKDIGVQMMYQLREEGSRVQVLVHFKDALDLYDVVHVNINPLKSHLPFAISWVYQVINSRPQFYANYRKERDLILGEGQ